MIRFSPILVPVSLILLLLQACGGDGDPETTAGGCTIVANEDGGHLVECADGTSAVLTDGEDGRDGADGSDGARGADGEDGNPFHYGGGLPAADLGNDGDFYYDVDRSAMFKKVDTEWYLADMRNDRVYPFVTIGNQTWMAENLNVGTRIDGVNDMDDDTVLQKYCRGNSATYCEAYGGLYQWAQALDLPYACSADFDTCDATIVAPHRGICPRGWHVPSESEVLALESHLGADAGGQLKDTGYDYWSSPNEGATNETGFTALGVGSRYYTTGGFGGLHSWGGWWTTTRIAAESRAFLLNNSHADMNVRDRNRLTGYTLRCLLD